MSEQAVKQDCMLVIPEDGDPYLGEGVVMYGTRREFWLVRGSQATYVQGWFTEAVAALATAEDPPADIWAMVYSPEVRL